MTVLALIAAALAATSPLPTPSAAPAEPPIARIAFGDLDLGSTAGARALDARIARAASQACRTVTGPSVAGRADCRATFREEALARLPVAARQDYAQSSARRLDL
ncbi:UrcA family protein [Brevundimonas sp. VNH65]|uniref:UrcA family protein n=1 Tax=Brevundimonas sp. VNH65 TaxID=3400917 RepID=UPI003C043797